MYSLYSEANAAANVYYLIYRNAEAFELYDLEYNVH